MKSRKHESIFVSGKSDNSFKNFLVPILLDRSVLFRDVDITDAGFTTLRCHRQTASHGIVYDMAIDPLMEAAVTVGQVKSLNSDAYYFGSFPTKIC